MGAIAEEVARARAGTSERFIARLASGVAVFGAPQITAGYALLLPDPVVPRLNDLKGEDRRLFLDDMAVLGDVLLEVTQAARINYEILGNLVEELHAHVIPRYREEPESIRTKAVWLHDWDQAPKFDPQAMGDLRRLVRAGLGLRGALHESA